MPSSGPPCATAPREHAKFRLRLGLMTRTALYTGSFDPVTNGHLDVVRQACRVADRLVVAIGVHLARRRSSRPRSGRTMLREVCGPIAAARGAALEVVTFDDLAVEAARRTAPRSSSAACATAPISTTRCRWPA